MTLTRVRSVLRAYIIGTNSYIIRFMLKIHRLNEPGALSNFWSQEAPLPVTAWANLPLDLAPLPHLQEKNAVLRLR